MKRTFKSFEAAFAKRLSTKWQAMASYSITRLHVPGSYANPNTRINSDNDTTEWEVKTSGSYELPWQLLTSIGYELRSGNPWQRTALLTGGVTIPNIVLPVEPLGSRYYDDLHLVNGRVRKEFRVNNQRFSAQTGRLQHAERQHGHRRHDAVRAELRETHDDVDGQCTDRPVHHRTVDQSGCWLEVQLSLEVPR